PPDVTALVPSVSPENHLITFVELTRLDSLGLIRLMDTPSLVFQTSTKRLEWYYFRHKHVLSRPEQEVSPIGYQVRLGQVFLTVPGRELVAVAGASPNEPYRASAVSFIRQQGWEVLETGLERDN